MSQVVEKLLQTLEALSIWAKAAALLSHCQAYVHPFWGSLPSPLRFQTLHNKEVSLEAYKQARIVIEKVCLEAYKQVRIVILKSYSSSTLSDLDFDKVTPRCINFDLVALNA